MSSFLIAVLGFIFVFGLVVFVHEGGHFLVARWNGIEVEAFALGMGPKLFAYQPGETEYRICVIPLGGYVKLAGEEIGTDTDNPRAFVNQPVNRRIMVLAAGVLCNLLLGYFLYVPYGMVRGEKIMPAKIGLVAKDMPAHGKLRVGDEILALNGYEMETFREITVRNSLLGSVDREFLIKRNGQRKLVTVTPSRVKNKSPYEPAFKVGISPYLPTVIDRLREGSILREKGLQTGDKIIAVGDTEVKSWFHLEQIIYKQRGRLPLVVKREGETVRKYLNVPDRFVAWRDWKDSFGLTLGETQPRIVAVKEESSAARAGFREGGIVQKFGDTQVVSTAGFFNLTKQHHGNWSIKVKYPQKNEIHSVQLPRKDKAWRNWYRQLKWQPPIEKHQYGFLGACGFAFRETKNAVKLLFEGLWGLITQRLSPRSLAGPVGIVAVTGHIATVGFWPLIRFTAFLSINLGVLNLLPIPVLDGGHIFLSLPELIDKPLPAIVFEVANKVGLTLLLALLLTVTFFDLARLELVDYLISHFFG